MPVDPASARPRPASGCRGARERLDDHARDGVLAVVAVEVGGRAVGDAVDDAARVADCAAKKIAHRQHADVAIGRDGRRQAALDKEIGRAHV